MEPDYSTYRLQLKSLKPDLDEKQIYQMYNGVMKPGRSTQTTPYLAEDGLYHCIYLTECLDDGRIYIGKHSTPDIYNDSYQGSGCEISDGKNLGKKFRTTWLEFFDSSDQAFIAEKWLVNANFVRNQKLVMNHVLGGKDKDTTEPGKAAAYPVLPTASPFKNPSPDKVVVNGRKRGSSFSELGVKPGSWLVFVDDDSQQLEVLDDWHVSFKGKQAGLSQALKSITQKSFKNPLAAFLFNGRNLAEIQKELRSR